MDYLILLLIAVSLALDCFTVSACITSIKKIQSKMLLRIFFIWLMCLTLPLYTRDAGKQFIFLDDCFKSLIEGFDHWVAFGLLSIIGIKMIVESVKDSHKSIDIHSEFNIIMLSIATSIDALVIGLAFSFNGFDIFISALIIGIISFLISLIGLLLGKKIHNLRIGYIGVLGGLILIGIGVKTLVSHIFV